MPVKEGDKVKEGQILAILDRTDIQKEVDIAQNSYDLAVANYNEQQILAENGYANALQALKDARDNYTRSAALFQSGGVSQVDLDAAKAAMEEKMCIRDRLQCPTYVSDIHQLSQHT